MKTYRTIINGKEKRLTKEELDYVKRIYGDWEYVYIFNSPDKKCGVHYDFPEPKGTIWEYPNDFIFKSKNKGHI